MAVIIWIIMGALAGWLASVITSRNESQGMIGNIIIGILGAFIGGWVMNMFGQGGADLGTFNLYSLLVATGGAVLLLFLFSLFARRR
jgi:uncharacterized membrane protein YeaQ/YmgE (transglycosylase-associated protein family)